MIRFCSIFAAVLLFATTALAQPVNTHTIEGSLSVLPSMTWLPDPQNAMDYTTAASPEAQSAYLPLPSGFPVQATGPGWLRLELAKSEQQSSAAPSRVDKKSLYLNMSFLPSGKATLYRTGSFSTQGGSGKQALHQPLASRVYPFQTERLAEPSIGNAVYYIHLEETPGLWFNPTLSRTDSKSPILPHDLLLPSILLACLAFSLLRLAIDRTIWPVWAAAILVCVIIGLLLPIPVATKTLTYKDLPVLLAPGIAVMIYAHLGRLLLYSPVSFPKADMLLRFYPIVGAVAALAPLLPKCYWLTRLFPLWGLLLIPLLVVAASSLARQLKGSFAYFVATCMPVLGAIIALYGAYNPGLNMLSRTGTFWGVAIGSFALIFARSALPGKKEAKEAETQKETESAPLDVFDSLAQKAAPVNPGLPGTGSLLVDAPAQGHKDSVLDVPPLTLGDGADDIFSSLHFADLTGKTAKDNLTGWNLNDASGPPSGQQREQHAGAKSSDQKAPGQKTSAQTEPTSPEPEMEPDSQAKAVPGTDTPTTGENAAFGKAAAPSPLDAPLTLDPQTESQAPLLTQSQAQAQSQSQAEPLSANAYKEQTDKGETGLRSASGDQGSDQESDQEDDDDILELKTLAEPSPDIPGEATSAQGLDWPGSDDFLSPASKPIDIFANKEDEPAEDPLLALSPTGVRLTVPVSGFTPSPADNGALNGSAASPRNGEETSPAKTDRPEQETIPAAQTPGAILPQDNQDSLNRTDEGENTAAEPHVPSTIAETDGAETAIPFMDTPPHKAAVAEPVESDMTVQKKTIQEEAVQEDTAQAAPIQQEAGPSASEESPEPPEIIRLHDESIEAVIPPGAAKKVDAVLASIGTIQSSSNKMEFVALADNQLEDALDSTLLSTPPVSPDDETLREMGPEEMASREMELADMESGESTKINETETLEGRAEETVPAESLAGTSLTASVQKSPSNQAASDRAYIEALLTPKDKHAPQAKEKPVLSPAESQYLHQHNEEERKLLESYGNHCIIITDMTTSNKRLLRSYFSEIAIPCIEAHGIDDTVTLQAKTGSPLVIYDADSPADTIVQCIERLDKAGKRPNHLILASVESQGKHLVEQGATLTISKPFTKESLFEAAYKTAPALFGESQMATIRSSFSDVSLTAASFSGMPKDTDSPLARENATNTAQEVASYAKNLLDGPQISRSGEVSQPSDNPIKRNAATPSETTPSGATPDIINEQRVDDLLAQLNNENVTKEAPRQTSAEQTASVISKVLSVEAEQASPSTATPEPQKTKDSLLDFIVTEDEAESMPTEPSAPARPAPPQGAKQETATTEDTPSRAVSASKGHEVSAKAGMAGTGTPQPDKGNINIQDEPRTDEVPESSLAGPTPAPAPVEGLQPLADFEGEYIEQLMLPLIPGLLYTLKDGLRDAEIALAEQHLFSVQEAVTNIAAKAEAFGLKKLDKIAQCVLRATSADDFEATKALMEDLGNITKRYIKSLETCYDEYIASSRSQ